MKKGTLLLLMFLSCSSVLVGQEKPKSYDDRDAYEVYAAIIGDEWPISAAKATQLVIQAETTMFPHRPMCLKPAPGDESTLGALITSYLKANEKPRLLQRKFRVELPYEVVSKSVLDEFFPKDVDGWPRFHARYPNSGGFIHMSAVGFNPDKTLALVYMGHWCAGLCGGGTHHLLEKKDGKWVEIPWRGEFCSWAS
jgi:hypothetical protein